MKTLLKQHRFNIGAGLAVCFCLMAVVEFAAPQIVSNKAAIRANATDLNLLRRDIRADVRDIMRGNFILPKEEAEIFWPIYLDYEKEVSAIWNERFEIIEEYKKNRFFMSDDDAQDIMGRVFALDEKMIKVRRTYFIKIRRNISGNIALRFMQLDRRINNLIEIQLAQDIPLAP